MSDSSAQRDHMVACQIRPNQVSNERLLAALEEIPREVFVPNALKSVAYLDENLEIAPGRYLMEPRCLARLIEAADIQPDQLVLEIGSGTGYSTAVLGKMADAVVAIEENKELAAIAEQKLASLGIDNVAVLNAPHAEGYAQQGPYSVIFINGAVENLPATLLDQLGEGGKLLYVRIDNGVGHGHMVTRTGGNVGGIDLFDAQAKIVPGFEKTAQFVF